MNTGSPAEQFPSGVHAGPELRRLAGRITSVIQHDPGNRGVARWAGTSGLLPAALSLLGATGVAITTGFYVLSNGVIETDGPAGAIVLADTLTALGKTVVLAVDEHAAGIMKAAMGNRAIPIEALPPGDSAQLRRLGGSGLSHIVAIERPGRSQSGAYFSMRGEDISHYVAATDELFLLPGRRYTTIGVGDGGNELGLQDVWEGVARFVPNGHSISCRTPSDFSVYAGVSNWGAYGLCAMISAIAARPLLPEPQTVVDLLTALVEAGAVDGIRRERCVTVDGLPLEYELECVRQLQALVAPLLDGQ